MDFKMTRVNVSFFYGVIGWATLITTFNSALFNADSVDIYKQFVTGNFNTWHSVFMSLLWRELDPFRFGPYALIAFTSTIIIASTYFFCSLFLSPSVAVIAVALFVIYPPILNLMVSATKDALWVAFFSLFIASTAEYLFVNKKAKQKVDVNSFIIIISAASCVLVRLDSIIYISGALFVFMAGQTYKYYNNKSKIITPKICFTIAFSVTLIFALGTVSLKNCIEKSVNAQRAFPFETVMVFDLAGTSFYSGINLFPQRYIEAGIDGEFLKTQYTPLAGDAIVFNAKTPRITTQNHNDELIESYIKAILYHPFYYLKHRLSVFYSTLKSDISRPLYMDALTNSDSRVEVFFEDSNRYNFHLTNAYFWNLYIDKFLIPMRELGTYDCYLYIMTSFFIIVFCFREIIFSTNINNINYLIFVIMQAVIIIGNLLVVLFFTPSSLFRYCYPIVCSTFYLCIVLTSFLRPKVFNRV